MAEGSNTSKFVKTYGKPRRTQLIGQNSLWNDDLNDDFDKCLGIEYVPQTTFISPEPSGSVTMYNSAKHKKKDENQKNSIGGWSMQLHSTLNGHRNNSSMKKRYTGYNLDSNYKKKKLLLKSAHKKKENLNIANNSKGFTTNSIKKLKNKFILSKEQCSTPLQKSMLLAHGKSHSNTVKSMSSKKRKKIKLKKNLEHAVNTFNSSELSLQLEHSHLNSSNILMEINDDYNNPFDESVQISSSHFPPSKNKYSQNSTSNNQFLNSPNRLCKVKQKKNSSLKEKNSNWYKKVVNIFCDEESVILEKSRNQDLLTSNEYINVCSFDPVITHETKLKPLEQKKQSLPFSNLNNISFQSLKHSNKSLSGKENQSILSLDHSQSNIENSIITTENIIKGTIKESQPSQPCILYDKYLSKHSNSLYESCYQIDKSKGIDDSVPQNDDVSINISNDEPFVNKTNNEDYKLLQPNQYSTTSSCNNATNMIQNKVKSFLNNSYSLSQDYSKVSSADHLDFKLLNILDRIDNNEKSAYPQNNQTSLISFDENIGLKSDDDQFVCCSPDSESRILLDVTTKFSDIIIDDTIEQCNKSIKEESLFGEFDHTLDVPLDISNHKHDIVLNNSSILHSSSSLEQDTVIYKQNFTDMLLTKINADNNDLLLNDKSIELKTSSKCYSEKDNLKYNNKSYGHTNQSNNKNIDSEQPLHILCEHKTIHHNINPKTELFNSDNDFNSTSLPQNFLQSDDLIDDHSISYPTQLDQNCTSFENISPIKCKEKISTEDKTIFSNSVSNDILEINESNLTVFMPRRKRYAARFQSLDVIDESDQLESILTEQSTTVFHLEPGKKWRRSISIVRSFMDTNMNQSINFTKGRKWANTVDDILRQQSMNISIHQNLDQSNILKNPMCSSSQRYLQRTFIDNINQNLDQSNILKNSMCNSSQNLQITSTDLENQKARSYIFEVCNQQELLSFESWLRPKCTNKWKKVGEGVYGEVFSYSSGNRCTIVKIIPIEGDVNINSEQQKKMFEVYSEIVVATELNKLCNNSNLNQTSSFCKLRRVSCVQGKYPSILINYWQQYDNEKGSDNDNPDILPKDQMFMILEMDNGGIDVENFIFNCADQSVFAFVQIVFGLAVAEEVYKFEHRDLHIGNILVKKCTNKKISYKLDGGHFDIPSRGIKITIIDFTLSRMTYNSKHVYNDLSKDTELFSSVGDYQFEIYRMMRKETNDQWESFKAATNIYWLHYVLDKMLTSVHYKKTNTVLHNKGLSNLERLKNVILSFNSAKSFAESDLILDLIG